MKIKYMAAVFHFVKQMYISNFLALQDNALSKHMYLKLGMIALYGSHSQPKTATSGHMLSKTIKVETKNNETNSVLQ